MAEIALLPSCLLRQPFEVERKIQSWARSKENKSHKSKIWTYGLDFYPIKLHPIQSHLSQAKFKC